MPSAQLESFAKKSNLPIATVEKHWEHAKEIVEKQYKDIEKDSDKFYALVTGVLKKMLKLNEEAQATTTTASLGSDAIHAKKMGKMLSRIDLAMEKKRFNEGTIFDKLDVILDRNEKGE